MPNILIRNSTTQSNVTGAGTVFNPTWDVETPYGVGVISTNWVYINYHAFVVMFFHLHFDGMSVLNSSLEVYLEASDIGDIPILKIDPSNAILSNGRLSLPFSTIVEVNNGNDSNFFFKFKIKVSGGLTNTVDMLAGSQVGMYINAFV